MAKVFRPVESLKETCVCLNSYQKKKRDERSDSITHYNPEAGARGLTN